VGFVDWNRGETIPDEQFQEWEVAAAMIGSWLEEIQRLLPFRIAGIHVRKLAS
jgi:hypothetical protein